MEEDIENNIPVAKNICENENNLIQAVYVCPYNNIYQPENIINVDSTFDFRNEISSCQYPNHPNGFTNSENTQIENQQQRNNFRNLFIKKIELFLKILFVASIIVLIIIGLVLNATIT